MTQAATSALLHFREVDQETWKDLERLFETRGGPKNCWCMVWRATLAESKQASGQSRKVALKHRVDEGTPIGIVGFHGQEPVAWCSIGPRTTYLRLGRIEDEAKENIWALVCFFLVRRLRGLGILKQLIDAAVAHAEQKARRSLRRIRLTRIRRAIVSWDLFNHSRLLALMKLAVQVHDGMSCVVG